MTRSSPFEKAAFAIRQVQASPGATYSQALRDGLETARAGGWREGFLLDFHKTRLTIDAVDVALWERARGQPDEEAIALETILFKALCARMSPGGEAAALGIYWLPVANAPDLRRYPFESAARAEFLGAAHETLDSQRTDRLLHRIEQEYFGHLLGVVLPGLARDPDSLALAAGPVFALHERLFGSGAIYEQVVQTYGVETLESALEALDAAFERAESRLNPALLDIKTQLTDMRWALIERKAVSVSGVRFVPFSSGPALN